jgi:antirestriction protein ArdC
VLRGDKRAIFTASSYAQRAADYLHELQAASPAPQAVTSEASLPSSGPQLSLSL